MKRLILIIVIAVGALSVLGQAERNADRQSPSISTQQIRSSLYGKRLTDLGNYNGRSLNWQFDRSEIIELDVLEIRQAGRKTIIVAHVRTADAPGIIQYTDTSYGRQYLPHMILDGRLRLTYETTVAGDQKLLKVENLSLRADARQVEFRNAGVDGASLREPSPIPPSTQRPAFPVGTAIANSAFHVNATGWRWFNFTLLRQSRVSGTFVAEGGGRNDIEGLVMTENEFVNWSNSNRNLAFYRSGNVTIGEIDVVLNPGRYVLVFYNSALLTGKTVTASVFAQ